VRPLAQSTSAEAAARSPEPEARVATPSVARTGLLVLGGLALAAVFLDPRAWPLGWIGLAPLFFFAPRARSVGAAARDGWLVGLAGVVPAFYWLVETIHRFGGFPMPVALLFYAALSAYAAAQFALVAAALRWAGPGAPVLLAPAAWTAVELLFPNLFPWRLGHSQRDLSWLVQIGDLAGPYGLSFVMAWLASAAVRRPLRLRALAAPLVAVAAVLAYGAWRGAAVERAIGAAPPFEVGIVQGNLGLDEKSHAEHFEGNVARYRRLTGELVPAPDLIVWPETVVEWGIPRDVELPPALDPLPGAPAPLVFGAVSYRRSAGSVEWFNSAFARDTAGRIVGRYDKIILMPFGEFIPFAGIFPSLKEMSPNTGDFQAGSGPGVLPASAAARVGALICYEDLLSGHVRQTVRAGANLLVTLANDAWFGTSPALEQHEMLALWRAVENRRFHVRATNTGLTSVIDPLGRRIAELPVEAEAATRVQIRLLDLAAPYTVVGDAFAIAAVALALGLLLYAKRSRNLAPTQGVAGTSRSRA
jgi:apolipoprotein N-acyltransferase